MNALYQSPTGGRNRKIYRTRGRMEFYILILYPFISRYYLLFRCVQRKSGQKIIKDTFADFLRDKLICRTIAHIWAITGRKTRLIPKWKWSEQKRRWVPLGVKLGLFGNLELSRRGLAYGNCKIIFVYLFFYLTL